MMIWVYVIENPQGRIYIGQTENVTNRLKRHNREQPIKLKSYSVKQKGPWILIYQEQFNTRTEALRREQELKSSRGRNFLRQFRKNNGA